MVTILELRKLRSVVLPCYCCGKPVSEARHLYCDKCFRWLSLLPVRINCIDKTSLFRDFDGHLACRVKSGVVFTFLGSSWVDKAGVEPRRCDRDRVRFAR